MAPNEMIPVAVNRYPDICLTPEENLGKPQLGNRLMKALRDQSVASNGVPLLQTSVGSHSTSGKQNKRE